MTAAAAAGVDIVQGDAELVGDLLGRKLVEPGQLEHLAVVVVGDLADGPGDELLGLEPAELGSTAASATLAQLGVVSGERSVKRPGLALGLERLVEAARGALVVAQLLAPVVPAGVLHARHERGVELPELALAEVRRPSR